MSWTSRARNCARRPSSSARKLRDGTRRTARNHPDARFQRGVAVAYCDSPGPLDKGQRTFYAVSPIPADWTEAQVGSFLSEYNTRSIANLTIHEAMPGHYLQIAHSNRYPSTLRAMLSSGPFVEGWAVAQLSTYFVGYQEHSDMRAEAERRQGAKFDLKAYHDQALSYGSPPVPAGACADVR
ncbi:MAG: DUF885 family protein [Proteobacteria bacterium]|nr:DUF885 family protein [Pseudomonadota bacterium]